jgi:hypothetical protein
MTHEADVKDRFIELRAEGLSYQRIAWGIRRGEGGEPSPPYLPSNNPFPSPQRYNISISIL